MVKIDDYAPSMDKMHLENMVNNRDPLGDPDKAGNVIVNIVESGNIPKRLPLGSDAVRIIKAELKRRMNELNEVESYSIQTDFDG